MKPKYFKNYFILISFILLSNSISFAEVLSSWEDENAYKPNPILFIHGFALGNAASWDYVVEDIGKYFNKYTQVTSSSSYTKSSQSYLERMNFVDPNGSVDTYDSGKFNPQGNSDGWVDKIYKAMNDLLPFYKFRGEQLKFNFVCHSMGGLAAREYLTNSKYGNTYSNIEKVITIGTPHAGTPIANIKLKLETAVNESNKYIWEVPYYGKIITIAESYEDNYTIELLRSDSKIDPNGEAVKDMAINSNFLISLNNRLFPSNIKKYAIFGEAVTWKYRYLNSMFFYIYYPNETSTCGDGIVPRDSQKGYDIMSEFPTYAYWVWQPNGFASVPADHSNELDVKDTVQNILKFLDSTPPEFTLDSPLADSSTIIIDDFINIKGKVYKEYLPADSKLHIEVTKVNDGSPVINEDRTGAIKASGLWQPNNPDSPVAEFDEKITLSGEGIYTVKVKIINPAEISSQEQSFSVVVMAPTDWWIDPSYTPEFPYKYAGWLSSENMLALFFSPKPPTVYPWASMTLEDISTARVGTPFYTSGVVIAINDTTEFAADYDYPCEIIFSRLELKNGGYVSGTITGQLRADLDDDGDWELHAFRGKFDNVQVFQQSSSSYSLKMKQFQLNSTQLKAISRFSIKK